MSQYEKPHEAGTQAFLDQFRKDQGFDGWPDRCIQAYLCASGMVLVPREPTYAMEDAADLSEPGWGSDIYRAMLSAAPDPFKS